VASILQIHNIKGDHLNYILLVSILACAIPLQAAFFCQNVFNKITVVSAHQLSTNQNFIGHKWSEFKLTELSADFNNSGLKKNQKKEFILEKTNKKPIPVIKDIDGKFRLIDGNHSLYTFAIFMGKNLDFNVNIKIFKDYSSLSNNGTKWTAEEMVQNLTENNWIFIYGNDTPTYKDLMEIPDNILKIKDLPERSLMGLVFREMDLRLKGSDFTPMIQLRLAKVLIDLGFNPLTKRPFGRKNLNRVKEKILKTKELLVFLLENLNHNLDDKRKHLVSEFLLNSLNKTQIINN
jgi:hypothetical protein